MLAKLIQFFKRRKIRKIDNWCYENLDCNLVAAVEADYLNLDTKQAQVLLKIAAGIQ